MFGKKKGKEEKNQDRQLTAREQAALAKKRMQEEKRRGRRKDSSSPEPERLDDGNKSLAQQLIERRKTGKPVSMPGAEKERKPLVETLPRTLCCDLFPIKDIDFSGMIITEDGRYLRIFEVMPINFLLRSEDEQQAVLYEFEKYLRILPDRYQFFSLSKKTDISRYLKKIDEEIAREKDPRCRLLQEDYKRLLQNVGALEAVSRRFFITLELDQRVARTLSRSEISRHMESMVDTAAQYLKRCGNIVVIPDDPLDGTASILFDILNRNLNASSDFEQRVRDVYAYYMMNYGEEGVHHIPIAEYFTPMRVDLRPSNFVKLDDRYYTFLYLKSNGYPMRVTGGWLSLLVNAGEGIDVSLFVEKQNRAQMVNAVGRRLRWSAVRAKDLNASTTEYDMLNATMESGQYLKTGMAGNQDFYYIAIFIGISADSLQRMEALKEALLQYLDTLEIFSGSCIFQMEDALQTYIPLARMETSMWRRSRRNVLTHDLSSFYPFTSYEMSDEDGVLLGINETNNSLCITDFFNTAIYKNANISILGTTGAGKTYLLQLLAMRFRRKQIQVFIIAPIKGHEFARACNNIGGQFVTISPASSQCINVMEIRKKDMTATNILEYGMAEQSELAAKIQSLHIFFNLLIPDITAEEDQLVDDALITAYKQKGITHDNDSLFDPERPGQYREMPILGDVYDLLKDDPSSRRVANIMNRLVHGSAASFNQQTNVDLDNLYTVIDISTLTGALLPVGMFIALDFVYSKAKENRTVKKAIILDEVWQLIGASCNNKAAEYVLEIFKIIRGYGGSAICATQDLNDFFALEDGKYGRGIINNSKTKIVLNLEKKEAESVQELLGLSQEELQKITSFQRGHGLVSTNSNNIPIIFKASELENQLITSDRAELSAIVAAAQNANR